jgi:hypothetical protein
MLAAFLRSEELAARLTASALEMPPLERDLVKACLPAVSLDPTARYPTALAFLEAFESAAAANGVSLATARDVAAFLASLRDRKTAVSISSGGP